MPLIEASHRLTIRGRPILLSIETTPGIRVLRMSPLTSSRSRELVVENALIMEEGVVRTLRKAALIGGLV